MNQFYKYIRIIAAVLLSGLIALLCAGALIAIFGFSFWALDTLLGFINLAPKFEYDALSFVRSVFFCLDAQFKPIFFVLWAVILFTGFRQGWIKKQLAWIDEKQTKVKKDE